MTIRPDSGSGQANDDASHAESGAANGPADRENAAASAESGGDIPPKDTAPKDTAPEHTTVDPAAASQPNEERMNPEQTKVFEQFRGDLEDVERKIAGEIDPGHRAMVVAGAVFVLLLSLILPHAGHTRGLDILFFDNTAHADHIGLPSRVFQWFVLIFGIGFSSLALLTRRWTLAWIAVAGSAIGSLFGVLSIWHRQTPGIGNYHGAGPGIGLILGTLAIVVLTFHWLKVVWSRTATQLAAEEQRRVAAVAEDERRRRWLLGDEAD